MFRLLKYLRFREWMMVLGTALLILAQVFFDLKLPEYMSVITEISTYGEAFGTIGDIWLNGAIMLLCALGSFTSSIATAFLVTRIGSNYSTRLRDALYRKVQSFSMAEINHFSTASLITRSTNDITQVQSIITMGLQVLLKAPVTAVWAIFKIVDKEWQWTLATGIAVVFVMIMIITVTLLIYKKFQLMQTLNDQMNQAARENLSGLRVIRAYNAEGFQEGKFDAVNEKLTKTHMFTASVTGFMSPLLMAVSNALTLAIYWIGAAIISQAEISRVAVLFSDMVVFISYGMSILGAFMTMIMAFMIGPRAMVSANRINEVLNTRPSITDGPGVPAPEQSGTVEFKDVSFRYPDGGEDVLKNISFTVEKGETVAIIGSTGCGKSSLINLIPRFYDVREGQILVDGHDVRQYKKQELIQKISYIAQKAFLFSGSIRDNIAFGDNQTDDGSVGKALDLSQSTEFVSQMDEGSSSWVAQAGQNYSGGQKQRLSIARALARKAEIYIFDDSFSALDYATDKKLRQDLKTQMDGATVLIVAQRIGTIKDSDKILVLDNGELVGQGKHQELLKTCAVYREIAESQLNEEELKNA